MKELSVLLFLLISFSSNSQETRSVLFLGNSYTYYNDMPVMLSQAANSAGDTFEYQSNSIPNASWSTHTTNSESLARIMQGNWDFVVLQGAGRSTGRDEQYLEENVYPYVNILNGLIEEYNPCGETMFYMTWGERNGVPSECPIWPPFCSYEEMDDLIRQRHLLMAENYEANTSPVGAVWRYIRDNNPSIDLYDPDGSHPSLAGSYAGAITFYSSIFSKDPNLVSYNSTLSPSVASYIREAVHLVVYDNLSNWYIGEHEPNSNFNFTNNGNLEYAFTSTSDYTNEFLWLFGDGLTSFEENPIHTYAAEGIYEVSLNVNYFCSNSSVSTQTISVNLDLDDFTNKKSIKVYPNPASSILNINTSGQIENDFQVEVYSILGKKIKLNLIVSEGFNKTLNIESLVNGIYFLKIITNNNQREIVKFIKK